MNKQEAYALMEELNRASSLYYNTGNSPLTDREYDIKLEKLAKWEEKTGVIFSGSPTQNIGAPVLDNIKKVELGRPMLSLAKVHSDQEVVDFSRGRRLVGTIKLDGLSVRLWYEDGKLVRAATRGNGTIGSDITEHARYFINIPLTISTLGSYIIDGEAIIRKDDFEVINANGEFKNPRNLAAGSLNLLDMAEVRRRRLRFIGWDVIEGDSNISYSNKMEAARSLGFETVFAFTPDVSNEMIMGEAERLDYPCDGVVWKFDDTEYGASLGRTAHHFNSGIAWKPEVETAWSKLIGIDYGMGRTGVLTPVALFEPIELEGTEVERASLHNLSVLEELLGPQPYLNQEVEVYKADLIVPQIKSAIKLRGRREDGMHRIFTIPDKCPVCGGPLKRVTEVDSTVLKCQSPECPGKLLNRINHFCSKKGMDIKGLSKSTLEKLIDWGWVNEFADLYELKTHREEWVAKPGFGPKSVDNILSAIEESRAADYSKFLPAIGIPQVGNALARDIIQNSHTDTYEHFREAVNTKWDFTLINGIGVEKASSILNFDYAEADNAYNKFTSITTNCNSNTSNKLEGYTVVITGSLKKFKNRTELTNFVMEQGGKVTSSISKNTTLLINNDIESDSSKNKEAKRLGIPIMSEEKFLESLTL